MTDPIAPWAGRALLTAFFSLHYLSALLTIGLAWLAAGAAWRRAGRLERDAVSIAVVNVSVTIVLGVAALLFVSVVHTRSFFTSSLLLFAPLMSVVPMLAVAAAALYAAKWWRVLESRPRARTALLALAGAMAVLVAAVFAAIGGLAWDRPEPGDSGADKLVGSTWLGRWAMALALSGAATCACVIVRYAWAEADEFGHRAAREAAAAGVAFCVAAGALGYVVCRRAGLAADRLAPSALAGAALLVVFLLVAFGRLRGRAAAFTTAGFMLALAEAMAVAREHARAALTAD